MGGVTQAKVSAAEAGMKLLDFLAAKAGRDVPRAALQRWIRTGQVRVDSRRAKPFQRLDEGALVRIPPHGDAAANTQGDQGHEDSRPRGDAVRPLAVLYEDAELVAVMKPRGLATQGGTGLTDSAADRLLAMYAGTGLSPAPVHRLDRDTTGVLLAGKTFAARRRLSDLFAARETDKTYLCWVLGDWPGTGEELLEDRMQKDAGPGGLEKMRTGQGRLALASVRPLYRITRADGARCTLMRVDLLTGRTHQIRVQLAARGHAVVGDRKYGHRPHPAPLLLHAWRLSLPGLKLSAPPDWTGEWAVDQTTLDKAEQG